MQVKLSILFKGLWKKINHLLWIMWECLAILDIIFMHMYCNVDVIVNYLLHAAKKKKLLVSNVWRNVSSHLWWRHTSIMPRSAAKQLIYFCYFAKIWIQWCVLVQRRIWIRFSGFWRRLRSVAYWWIYMAKLRGMVIKGMLVLIFWLLFILLVFNKSRL